MAQRSGLGPKNSETTRWLIDHFIGHDVFIVGGGPSLHGFNFQKLERKKVIAVNHSYMYVKHDILCFLDYKFKEDVMKRGHRFEDMQCKIICGPCSGMKTGGNVTMFYYAPAPSKVPTHLFGAISSTLCAINAAIIMGAKRIFLLGIDCCFSQGMGHFYSDKWRHHRDGDEAGYKRQIRQFDLFKGYKNIYNLSKISRITAFKRLPISEIL